MNLLSYIDFVAPLIIARRFNIPVEEAQERVINSLTPYALSLLSDEEKEWLGIGENK